MAPYNWPAAKPGSGGVVQNAKAQPNPKQAYGKGKGVAAKHPAKKGGMSGDTQKKRTALAAKKK